MKLQLHEKKEQPQSLIGDSETGEIHLMTFADALLVLTLHILLYSSKPAKSRIPNTIRTKCYKILEDQVLSN